MATDRAPPAGTPAALPRRRAPALRIAGTALLVALVLLAGVVATVGWALRTASGTAWLLARLPGVQAVAPRGALLGDFEVGRLVVRLPNDGGSVALTGLGWKGLAIERGDAGRWLRIALDDLHADRVDAVLAPSPAKAPAARRAAPTDLRLPVEVELRSLRVAELHATPLGDTPVRALHAALQLGADGGRVHRLTGVSASWNGLTLTARGEVGSDGTLPVDVHAMLRQPAGGALPPWTASAALRGPLAAPRLQATVRVQPAADRPAQSLDASAALRPFAAWPLGELEATLQALDLSAFGSAAPATALSGRATVTTTALDQPAHLTLDLANAAAGRWDAHRLPLRRVAAALTARPDDPSTLSLTSLDAELGVLAAGAGRITGTGRYGPTGWTLNAEVADLRPAGLDARAPSMRLDGPLAVDGAGATITVRTTLAGRWTDAGPVRTGRLVLDASLDPRRLVLRSATAEAGGARATLAGTASRADPAAPWAVKGAGALVRFDPRLWWPGAAGSAWRQAPTSLDATATADLVVPAAEPLAGLRGDAAVTIAETTRVAGVAVAGEARLRTAGGTAMPTLRLVAAGNEVQLDGRLALSGNGAGDHVHVALDAGALDRLAPVIRLVAPPGSDATLAGRIVATADVDGRWPAVSSHGEIDTQGLRVAGFGLRQARGRWRGATAANAPLDAELALTDATLAPAGGRGPSIESIALRLQGTGGAHTLTLSAVSRSLPPAWTAIAQPPGPSPASRTIATLQASGGFVGSAGAAWAGWRGRLDQARLGTQAAADGTVAPLLSTRDVQFEAGWSGGPARVALQPGRAEVLGGAVRWGPVAWVTAPSPGTPMQIDGRIDVDPVAVAPLLARLQPDFGWGGDLRIGGHAELHGAPTFRAVVVVERSAGDLSVTDELGTRTLGLSELRLSLTAADGVWRFSQALAGRTVGTVSGTVTARTSPTATALAPDTPLEGQLRVDVADLGSLGPWLPAGWRLDGALRASAAIGGRVGAPESTGTLRGSGLRVRNFLQGIDIGNGELAVVLRGDTARIERFDATAGDGTLRIEGDAALGAAPAADLRVTATRFQVLGRVDRRIVASGQARLRLDAKAVAVGGRFAVDEGLIDISRSDAPTLSDDVEVVRARGVVAPAAAASAANPAPVTPTARNVALDLHVSMGEKLRIRGHGIDAGLRGELAITSPGGRLAVTGSISTVDGTYQAYGQKLTIDRGVISFDGPVDNPRLDIEATRPGLDNIRVGVAVSGPTSNPRVRLFSEPDLSDIDKLSYLVMGRASDGLGRADTALLQTAALALLSGEGPGMSDRLIKSIGLDELSVGQKTDGDVRETVVSLGKQLSRRWYVGYERGLNATAGSWQLIYRIAQRLTVRAQAGSDSSLDLIWTWRWQ